MLVSGSHLQMLGEQTRDHFLNFLIQLCLSLSFMADEHRIQESIHQGS